jgi:hypothetical protein
MARSGSAFPCRFEKWWCRERGATRRYRENGRCFLGISGVAARGQPGTFPGAETGAREGEFAKLAGAGGEQGVDQQVVTWYRVTTQPEASSPLRHCTRQWQSTSPDARLEKIPTANSCSP